jgi:uncharacterized protein YjbI with pentapeptide repeats
MFELVHRYTRAVLYRSESAENMREAVVEACERGADLRGADLRDADLRDADLSDAVLRNADLRDADLRDADLSDAVLRNADLSDADLSDAVLSDADLSDAVLRNADLSDADLSDAVLSDADLSNAVLRNADLSGADLRGADLRDADLRGADLRDAVLTPIRDDMWAVLSGAPNEVAGLRKAIVEGRINGSTYEGECACLVGTIANVAGKSYQKLDFVKPNAGRPIERFFMGIERGHTPENNQFSKLALEWLDQWVENIKRFSDEGLKNV